MMAITLANMEIASEYPELESDESVERDFFLDLPEDVRHLLLCSYIGPQCTVNLSACSSTLHGLCSNDDLWKDFCCKELHLKPKQLALPQSYSVREGKDAEDAMQIGAYRLDAGPILSYWELYSQLLHPFHGLLGKLLVSYTSVYGDMLTLTYADGRIIGSVWMLPKKITDNMKPVVDFVICLDRDGKPMVVHQFAMDGSSKVSLGTNSLQKYIHRFEAPRIGDGPVNQDNSWTFGFRRRSDHSGTKENEESILACFFNRTWTRLIDRIRKDGISYPNASSSEDAPLRFHVLAHDKFREFLTGVQAVNACCRFEHRVQTNPAPVVFSSGLALPLGFFKGTYGAHGNELIKMEYAEDTRNLRGIKMTGDPNVPAGKITFEFPIDHAVVLPLEQQHDVDFLEALHQTGPFQAVDRLQAGKQDFRFPMGVSLRDASYNRLVGDTCQFRLMGHGTIAEHGFVNPTSIIANIVVFSPERFVVFWLGGYNFASLFLKVANDDLFCAYY